MTAATTGNNTITTPPQRHPHISDNHQRIVTTRATSLSIPSPKVPIAAVSIQNRFCHFQNALIEKTQPHSIDIPTAYTSKFDDMHCLCYGRLALGVALPTMAIYLTPKDEESKEAPPKAPQRKQGTTLTLETTPVPT